jgi:hypothetical protein
MKRRSEDSKAARAFSRLGVEARMKHKTPEQRSEQARRAAASRRDRQPKGPWFGVILYPENFVWRGVKHAIKVLDDMHNNPQVVFWSQDLQEARAVTREYNLEGSRMAEIIEQAWDPSAFRLTPQYKPDADAARQALTGGRN